MRGTPGATYRSVSTVRTGNFAFAASSFWRYPMALQPATAGERYPRIVIPPGFIWQMVLLTQNQGAELFMRFRERVVDPAELNPTGA
jgi:hypothetical protein